MAPETVPYRKVRDERYFYRGNVSDGGVCRLRLVAAEGQPPVSESPEPPARCAPGASV